MTSTITLATEEISAISTKLKKANNLFVR